MDGEEEGIGCYLVTITAFVITLVISVSLLLYFYFHTSLVFILLGIFLFLGILFREVPVLEFLGIGCLFYVNLIILVIASIIHVFGFHLIEHIVLWILFFVNLLFVLIEFK